MNKLLLTFILAILSSRSVCAQAPPVAAPDSSTTDPATSQGKQPKRILGVIPNYRAVSAGTKMPPESVREKFNLATQDSFDYSAFILAGMLAGLAQTRRSTPEFGQEAAGYGRYYWHSLADEVSGNYLTEAILPSLTHEDPRYYTLGHGRFFWRVGYAMSRLAVTKTDSGHSSLNFSEIVGNGVSAVASNAYYPAQERSWVKTRQKWAAQLALDGVFDVFKEFWPDINAKLLHQH